MSKFKHKRKKVPPIPTTSMPDVIFIILFFFMMIAIMKDYQIKVEIKEPVASERKGLSKNVFADYIYVGKLKPQPWGITSHNFNRPRIQINDQIADIGDISFFLENDQHRPYLREFRTIVLSADRYTTMGIVTDIKDELRKQGMLKIQYQARQDLSN